MLPTSTFHSLGFFVASAFLEIVQLANGDIVLKRSDAEEEPLVNIHFSEASKVFIGDAGLDIAKIMIQAGIQAAAHISEKQRESDESALSVTNSEEHTLH